MSKKQFNTYQIHGDIVTIFTNKGEQILIDYNDFELISQYTWFLDNGYAIGYDPKQQKRIRMHRLLMQPPHELVVDHINHKRWDNRRENLRICTAAQNQHNAMLRKDNVSGIKGVYYCKSWKRWIAQIKINGKEIHLGSFKSKEAAIKARQLAEIQYYGSFSPIQQSQLYGSIE